MIKEKLINYLQEQDLPFIEREEKVSHACINPEHDDSSPSAFTVLSEGEEFNYCSSCGFSLNTKQLHDFFEVGFDESLFFMNKLNKLLEPETDEVLARNLNQVVTPKVFLPPKFRDFDMKYRSISGDLFCSIKAYYTETEHYYGKRIIIPMYDYKGNLKSFEAISTNKKTSPKVLRPKGDNDGYFGLEEYLGVEYLGKDLINKDTVFIAEGFFSALSFWEKGYQGLCNFGVSSVENKLEVLYRKGIKRVILCGDNDEVGRKFNKEMYFLLRDSFEVTFFKYKWEDKDKCDANDLLKQNKLQERIDKTLGKV